MVICKDLLWWHHLHTSHENKTKFHSVAATGGMVDLTCEADEEYVDLTTVADSPVVVSVPKIC